MHNACKSKKIIGELNAKIKNNRFQTVFHYEQELVEPEPSKIIAMLEEVGKMS